jgi:hypothetical membrane protein
MKGFLPRRAVTAGLLVGPIYLLLIGMLGILEPGFSHRTSLMSLLGGVPGWRGLTFNAGVIVTGSLIIAFALGLRRVLPSILSTTIGIWLLSFGGIGLIGAGLFGCNEGCRNILVEPNLIGRLHTIASVLGGMGCGLSLVFVWQAMRCSDHWSELATPTLVAAILANFPGIVFWITLVTNSRLYSAEGFIQRMGFIVVLIWIFFAALRMRKLRTMPSEGRL